MNVLPESYYYKIVEGWWCMENSAGTLEKTFMIIIITIKS